MHKLMTVCALSFVICSTAWSGVVIEMQHSGEGAGAGGATDTIYAQGAMLRMEPAASQADDSTFIFRDDTLYLLDEKKKQAQTISKQDMHELSAQLGDAMKQMEAQLADLPPEQRAMMEKMMKDRMPSGMGKAGPPRRIKTGGSERVGDYSCTVRTMYAGDEKIWEVCSAADAGDAAEALEAFRAMSEFTGSLRESLQQMPFGKMLQLDTPFHAMGELEGFPVRVRMYRNGKLFQEQTLKSVSRRDLDAGMFAVPQGYKVKSLADEAKKDKRRR